MLPPFSLEQTIEKTVREEWGRILSCIVKTVGDFQLAEDSLQDAIEIALQQWQQSGLPHSPAAWLIQAARRKAIDRIRRDTNFASKQSELAHLLELTASDNSDLEPDAIPDKRLEMLFTCCHPALAEKTRIALTLRTIGGLTTDEIANAFLDSPTTMAQRLVRAKKKIALANIPYEIPERSALTERLKGVLAVIYLIFNEGYTASSGNSLTRINLLEEAVRLARITQQLLPEKPEIAGLLSLMLLHDSRRFARLDEDGHMIALENQNRALWDNAKITEGQTILRQALSQQQVGPYQVQAAISAIHVEAHSWEETDWLQIAALYGLLYQMQPSPVIRINHAMAVSYADSIEAALTIMDEIEQHPDLEHYHTYFVTKADLMLRAGRPDTSRQLLKQAIALSDNRIEKRFLQQKFNQLG